MDPITHLSTGILISNAVVSSHESLVPTMCAAVAAIAPDLDFVTKLSGNNTLFLKFHRGLTHSILSAGLVSGVISFAAYTLTSYPNYSILLLVSLLSTLSHPLLDALMNSAGIPLFAPFTIWKVSLPIFLGTNPMTSSAQCAKKSILVCLKCQLHSACFHPITMILVGGLGISLMIKEYTQMLSCIVLFLGTIYVLFCLHQRKKAMRLWAAHLRDRDCNRRSVFVGGFDPFSWHAVVDLRDSLSTAKIDSRKGTVDSIQKFIIGPEIDAVRISRSTQTIREFLDKALFPFVSTSVNNGTVEVKWQDLAYAFSPHVDLFTAKVVIDQDSSVVSEEFRERWS